MDLDNNALTILDYMLPGCTNEHKQVTLNLELVKALISRARAANYLEKENTARIKKSLGVTE